jgi:putative DNA primase/helicase
MEPVNWLWQGWLAAGKLHVLAGAPGTGKTTISLSMAATITCGGRWPDGAQAQRGDVLIWSGEDDPADVLAPRLKAACADLSRVHFVRQVLDAEGRRPFDPAKDMTALVEAARGLPELQLLILDPIVNAVGGDSHKNTEVRRALAPVVELAESLRLAALGISHFSKGSAGRDPVERVTGSLAFGALPRMVLVAAKIKTEDGAESRLLARAKSNLGPDGGGFAYTLEQVEIGGGIDASRVKWGAAVEGSARQLLAEADADTEADSEHRDVAEWLREVLADLNEADARTLRRLADEAGHAWRTVQRAAKKVGVLITRHGFGADCRSIWRLPLAPTDPLAPLAPDIECGATGATEAQAEVF